MMTEFEYVTAADDGSQWMVHDELSLYSLKPSHLDPIWVQGHNY